MSDREQQPKAATTPTFLGKWQIYNPDAKTPGYASYVPQLIPDSPAFSLWAAPPGKESNIALLLVDAGQLCFLVFLLNNGQYPGRRPTPIEENDPFPLVNTLEEAMPFFLPGVDLRKLGTKFDGKIMVIEGGFVFPAYPPWVVTTGFDYSSACSISQVTPSLASIQASGKGDGLDFAWVDLSGADLQNLSLTKADFSHCHFEGTILSNASFAGAVFEQSDLTSVIADPLPKFYNTPLLPPSPANPRTSLVGCRLNQSLIANDWSMLDLTGATVLNLSSPLSSAAKPLIAKYATLIGLNKNDMVALTLQNAVFDNAVLDGLGLNSSDRGTSDLTGASFILASMHGTDLSGAILKGANLSGAQLGSLSQLFTLPPGYETHLNAGLNVDSALRDQFAQHGITLSATATLTILETGRVWRLNDAGNNQIYTVRLEAGNVKTLTVYAPATAASLVNAYMPNAILTGANLNGVIATGAQFYGAKALVDGFAILEEVEFNDANLSNVNFTQANLYGANLSGAQLFNAKFIQAHLSPSTSGVPANLSGANLQGADFTGATLDGANLANAAVAINVPTKGNPKQGGVYLFSLPYSGDKATLAQYIAELDAATTGFTLPYNGDPTTLNQYAADLNNKDLQSRLAPAFKKQRSIDLSATAQVKDIEVDSVWQIVDGTQSYTLWTDPDETGTTKLYVAPSLINTQAGFEKRNMVLRWQTSATADTPGQQWLLDNDSENQKNFSTGYVRFIVKLNGNVLDVYGTAVHVERLGDDQKLQIVTETCNETILGVSNMNSKTVCPNESTLGVNQAGGKTWDPLWLRAGTPPAPPTCVPTDYQFCPPKTKQTEIRSDSQRASEPIDRDRR